MTELVTLQEITSLAATPVGIVLIYYLGRLNNKISLLELEIKHLRELINGKVFGEIEK